jgi:hypothetical protein
MVIRMIGTTRRSVILGVAATFTFAAAKATPLMPIAEVGARELASHLVCIFQEPAAATAIGNAYLRDRPNERHAEHLLHLLLANAPDLLSNGVERARPYDLHELVRRNTRSDFADGRTVWVEGLLLAQTEARLYALAALT